MNLPLNDSPSVLCSTEFAISRADWSAPKRGRSDFPFEERTALHAWRRQKNSEIRADGAGPSRSQRRRLAERRRQWAGEKNHLREALARGRKALAAVDREKRKAETRCWSREKR